MGRGRPCPDRLPKVYRMPASTTKTWQLSFRNLHSATFQYFQLALCYRHGASKKNLRINSDHVVAGVRFVTRDPLRSFVSPKSAGMAGSGIKSDLPGVTFSVTFSVTWTVSTTRDVFRKTGRAGIKFRLQSSNSISKRSYKSTLTSKRFHPNSVFYFGYLP